ncbi:hypothetical protein GALL_548610 [mine drainage metagenome]|uniref:Uncharacterized protein n=1 Tax=mine drainage metagenome TaxID=410659 RepID=A0A1J5PJ56_9ZZZZ
MAWLICSAAVRRLTFFSSVALMSRTCLSATVRSLASNPASSMALANASRMICMDMKRSLPSMLYIGPCCSTVAVTFSRLMTALKAPETASGKRIADHSSGNMTRLASPMGSALWPTGMR